MKTHNAHRTPRGQSMVLSALGMVVLVMMVCMTLSFGTKAKQKMEVQIVADQAAYSTSVATARSFNILALVNRVMIAHMTAMLGIQSAVSFATNWFMVVQSFFTYYTLEVAAQTFSCVVLRRIGSCAPAAWVTFNRWLPTSREMLRLLSRFPTADRNAAAQARRTSLANNFLYLGQAATVSTQLWGALNSSGNANSVSQRVMRRASGGSPEWLVPRNSERVTKREAGFLFGIGPVGVAGLGVSVGAVNESNLILWDRHAVMASMGSRGHFFTADRATWLLPNGVKSMMNAGINRLGAGGDWTIPYIQLGHGAFGAFVHQDGPWASLIGLPSTLAIADDHGFGMSRVRYRRPPFWPWPLPWNPGAAQLPAWPIGTLSLVQSQNPGGGLSMHFGLGTLGAWFDAPQHTVPAACIVNCPSAWTNFVDYSPWLVTDWRDNYAQPKAPTTIVKTLSARDPFNLLFNLRFTPAGATPGATGQGFDMKKGTVGFPLLIRDGAGTADISSQMGYSTGITYYHRAGHWKEQPNLFNPFWRAGLTRADTDRAAKAIRIGPIALTPDNSRDIENTMTNSGAPWAANAYCELYRAGYQGILPCP